MFASSSTGIYRSTNAVSSASPTWLRVFPNPPVANTDYFCADVTFLPILNSPLNNDANVLFATVTELAASIYTTRIIYSGDGGTTWQDIPSFSTSGYVKANIEISAANPNVLYIYLWSAFTTDSPTLIKYDYQLNFSNVIINPVPTTLGTINCREGWDFAFAVSNTDIKDFMHAGVGGVFTSNALGFPILSNIGANSPHVDRPTISI